MSLRVIFRGVSNLLQKFELSGNKKRGLENNPFFARDLFAAIKVIPDGGIL